MHHHVQKPADIGLKCVSFRLLSRCCTHRLSHRKLVGRQMDFSMRVFKADRSIFIMRRTFGRASSIIGTQIGILPTKLVSSFCPAGSSSKSFSSLFWARHHRGLRALKVAVNLRLSILLLVRIRLET